MELRADIDTAFKRHIEIYSQLDHKNDRVAVISALTYYEGKLQGAIERKFRPLSNTMRERLFEGYGPISTFSAKIDIAFALGILDGPALTDLRKANKVRNLLAHSFEPLTFEHPPISKLISEMTTPTKVPPPTQAVFDLTGPRGRYLVTLNWLGYLASLSTP